MTGTAPSRPLEFESLEPEEQLRRSREFLQRMRRRRTVRDFSSRPVPYELIENAIRVAGSAPSGANQQPWTFVAISDPGTKRRIRIAAEAEERVSYESRMSDEWLAALEPLGTTWRKPFLEVVPWIIVVFRQAYGLSIDPESGEERRFKHYYSEESVGIAVGLLLASLHLAGLATVTHTPGPMKFLAELLGRPANERAFVMIPVGYPAPDARVPRISKKELGDILLRITPEESQESQNSGFADAGHPH